MDITELESNRYGVYDNYTNKLYPYLFTIDELFFFIEGFNYSYRRINKR